MSDVSAESPGNLALLYAIVSDPEHRERIKAIGAANEDLNKTKAALDKQVDANAELLRQIQAERKAAEAAAADLAAREEKLKADTAGLTEVVKNHTAERERWEKQRVVVEAAHKQRGEGITRAETKAASDITVAAKKAAEVQARAIAIAQREAKYEKLRQAVQALQNVLDEK